MLAVQTLCSSTPIINLGYFFTRWFLAMLFPVPAASALHKHTGQHRAEERGKGGNKRLEEGQELFIPAAASVCILLQAHSIFLKQSFAQVYISPAVASIVSSYFITWHLIVPFISPEGKSFNISVGLNMFCSLPTVQRFRWCLSQSLLGQQWESSTVNREDVFN